MEGQKEATTHAHTARSVGMRLPLFFSVVRVGRRAHLLCVGSTCALQSDGKSIKKNSKKEKEMQSCRREGEREERLAAQESSDGDKAQQQMSKGRRERVCFLAFWGSQSERGRAERRRMGLSAVLPGEPLLSVRWRPTYALFCDTLRKEEMLNNFYYIVVNC